MSMKYRLQKTQDTTYTFCKTATKTCICNKTSYHLKHLRYIMIVITKQIASSTTVRTLIPLRRPRMPPSSANSSGMEYLGISVMYITRWHLYIMDICHCQGWLAFSLLTQFTSCFTSLQGSGQSQIRFFRDIGLFLRTHFSMSLTLKFNYFCFVFFVTNGFHFNSTTPHLFSILWK